MFIFNYKFQIYKLLFFLVLFMILTGLRASSATERQQSLFSTQTNGLFSPNEQTAETCDFLEGWANPIGLEFLPNGVDVVIGARNCAAVVDVYTGAIRRIVSTPIGLMDVSPNGQRILTRDTTTGGITNGTASLWNLSNSTLVQKYPIRSLETLNFSADNTQFLAGTWDDRADLYDIGEDKRIRSFPAGLISDTAFTPDSKSIAIASGDTVKLWNKDTGELIRTFQKAGYALINSIDISADGTQLAALHDGISVWRIDDGQLIRTFAVGSGTGGVYPHIEISPKGQYILADKDIWDLTTGLKAHQFDECSGISTYSPNGDYVLKAYSIYDSLTNRSETRICLFDTNNGNLLHSLTIDTKLSTSPDEIIPLSIGNNLSSSLKSLVWQHYGVDVERNRTLRVAITPTQNIRRLEVYTRYNSLSTLHEHYSIKPTVRELYEIIVTPTRSGRYLFSVLGWTLSDEQGSFKIEADYVDQYLSNISPQMGGNQGQTSVELSGAGFEENVQIELRGNSISIAPKSMRYVNTQSLVAELDLVGKPLGIYDLHAIWPDGQTQTIPNAFEIVAGQGAKLDATLVAPEVHRPQRINPLTIQYANIGDADLPAPLFVVSAQPSVPLRTLCDTVWRNGPVQLLGLNPNAPLDRLPPGINGVTHAQFEGGEENLTFQLDIMDASPQPVPWDSFKATMRPTAISESEWNTLWPQLTARLGATWADYLKVLHRNAQRLRQQNDTPICVPDLLMMEVDALRGKGLAAISGKVINAATGAPLLGVDIGARQEGGTVARLTATDLLDGSFTFANLPDGNYQLSVEGHVLDPKVIVPIANHQDALGMEVAARPYVPPPTQTAPEPADSQPALTVDATGNAHMVWQRGGEIWYAHYNEQGQWVETQPISNAVGTAPVIAYNSKLVGGNAPGLAVVWEADDGTGSYLKQSIAPMSGNTVNGWSTAADVTNSQQSDGQAALATLANGQPLVLWLQRDMKQEDDTDLYYKPLNPNLILTTDMVRGSGNLVPFMSETKSCIDLTFPPFLKEASGIPLLGGLYKFSLLGPICVEETGLPLCKLNVSGEIKPKFSFNEYVGVSGGGTLAATTIIDQNSCRYVVDEVSIQLNGGGELKLPLSNRIPLITALNTIPGMDIKIGAILGVNLQGKIAWVDLANPINEYNFKKDVKVDIEGGVFGRAMVYDSFGGEVKGTALANLCLRDDLDFCSDEPKYCVSLSAELNLLFIEFKWLLKEGECASTASLQSTMDLGLPSEQQLVLTQSANMDSSPLEETLIIKVAPPVGTPNIYEGQSVLASLGNDLANDSRPSVARNRVGTTMVAWNKDSQDLSQAIGNSVVLAEYNGSTWNPPIEIQPASSFNRDTVLTFDASNQPIVLWASAPANISLTTPITDILSAINATDILFSYRSGATWSAPAPIAVLPGADQSVQVAAAPSGEVMATWLHTDGNNIFNIYTSLWNGSSWLPPVAIKTESYIESLALTYAHNKMLLVWSQKTNINSQSFNDLTLFHTTWENGVWFAPTPMSKLVSVLNAAHLTELASPNVTSLIKLPIIKPPAKCCWECPPDAPHCEIIPPDVLKWPFPIDTTSSTNIRSLDPNEKIGLAGQGDQQVVAPGAPLRYTIFFENMATASAPAQEVFITDQLDTNLDLATLRFEEVTIADKVIPVVDESLGQFHIRQSIPDYRSNINKTWWVDITGQLEPVTRVITWTLRILDPETGDLPVDALAGFLPPNDATGRGEGHVTFSIYPNTNTNLGTRINNKATIVFDTNPPIITNEVFNTIDHVIVGKGQVYLPLVLK